MLAGINVTFRMPIDMNDFHCSTHKQRRHVTPGTQTHPGGRHRGRRRRRRRRSWPQVVEASECVNAGAAAGGYLFAARPICRARSSARAP